ncbi:3-octaprenyl-4hydroxybenzoate decarboxylase [Bradyrhizobium sp. Rc3b]|uniref:UbiD family decarboxylase n=1 Tax=unclassified Bradyrhizobium TaxID=2631580 RepID=UPI0008DEE9E0|nr:MULTISPECIES: UbiD family decarboxylase [unclassified Bradyrhizobium]MBB4377160.1 4-hydroxy-3-polyprenylbenzoate decarboxylase [Bradyrhizobium sp. SBR1B]SFM62192.1 3-octaprenyl-4hydroxybenzoate decarboxylase [Bradyrhizobium sp. Rc3b]
MQRDVPRFRDLSDFLRFIESRGQLRRIREKVSVVHEITEIHRRVLEAHGPALLFEQPVKADGRPSEMPLLTNLFGTVERIAWGMGIAPDRLGELGELMAELRAPRPPHGIRDVLDKLPLARAALATRPRTRAAAPVQDCVAMEPDIDLARLPVQICWPGEPAPLITWPLVITVPPDSATADQEENVGVYRMQVLGRDRAIIRWLAHRGGARHHQQWKALGRDMPVAIVIGADPATILAAVLPLPETLSELRFSGILRGERPDLAPCLTVPLAIPAEAEIVIEGFVSATETAPEGPYGDHTGYYNSVEEFPVMRVTAITSRRQPVYLSTFTGRPPDEPSRIGEALNQLFVPLIRQQFPEVTDCWLPPEACSYRVAIAAIKKRYPGQARRLMLGLWSMLPQFSYTKLLIVVDDDIDIRDWRAVMWAVSTRSDSSRDLVTLTDTPIDYLDFASPKSGLGGKLGIDATTKILPETDREWGVPLAMDPAVVARVDAMWSSLGLSGMPARAPVLA